MSPVRSRTAPGKPSAVVGVVVAGVLASFVIPGPYAWDTTMLGVLLLLILIGYGHFPRTAREAVGTAAAVAFVLLFTFGRFLDIGLGDSQALG
jgi:hypothetical protein